MGSAESHSEGGGPCRIHLNADLHPISHIPSFAPETCYCQLSDSVPAHPTVPWLARDPFPIHEKPAKTSVLCSNHLLFLRSPSGEPGAAMGITTGLERPTTPSGWKSAAGLSAGHRTRLGEAKAGTETACPIPPPGTPQLGGTRILRPLVSSAQKAANQPPSPHTTAAS